jgi:hypothetical protein
MIFRFNFKNILYFFIVCSLGFQVGIHWEKYFNNSDGFVDGYVRCCYDIEHGHIQIIDSRYAYVIPRSDSIIKIPIKIISN